MRIFTEGPATELTFFLYMIQADKMRTNERGGTLTLSRTLTKTDRA